MWETCHKLLIIRFGEDVGGINYGYDGKTNPKIHIESCIEAWLHRNADEWVHLFAHTLDTSPRNWYTETELHRGTENWSLLTDGFKLTFELSVSTPKLVMLWA